MNIDYPREANGENPDKTNPIVAVDSYTLVSDEYVKYIYIGKYVKYIAENGKVTNIGMDYREAFRVEGSTRDEQYLDLRARQTTISAANSLMNLSRKVLWHRT